MSTSIGHMPSGRWSFDESVASCFDDMVERSIPLYEQKLDMVARLSAQHIRTGDTILDLGVSRGNAVCKILERLSSRAISNVRVVGIDNSKPMLVYARDRLPESSELIEADLETDWPYRASQCKPKVILALWVAQFISIENRSKLFARARESVASDGCMFVAEKLRGQTSTHQAAISKAYSDWKCDNGYTTEEVEAKAESLKGVLVSLSAPETKTMLLNEGWWPEEVMRSLGFALYYCVPK